MSKLARWVILFVFLPLIIFSILAGYLYKECGNKEGEVAIPAIKINSRLVIKFSKGTPRGVKEQFFKSIHMTPIAYGIFGFDVAGWEKTGNILKGVDIYKKFNHFISSLNGIDISKISINDYQIEVPEIYRIDTPKAKSSKHIPGEVYRKKLIIPWYEKYIQKEAAHKFLKEKKAKLVSNGIIVVDNAPEFSHPDLAPVLKKDKNGKPIYWAWNKKEVKYGNHGTHVSCLAGGYRNGKGVDGVAAPNSYIIPLIVGYNNRSTIFASDVAIGLHYLIRLEKEEKIFFRVVNMSFSMHNSKIVFSAMKTLDDKLFVVAAGNSEKNLDKDKKYYPAAWNLSNKIAVAATQDKDRLAYFSNYGKESVAMAAPGADILSCVSGGGYKTYAGTSMASPLVAGAVSLLVSIDPDAKVRRIKNVLFHTANTPKSLKEKVKNGRRLNVNSAVRYLWFLTKDKR